MTQNRRVAGNDVTESSKRLRSEGDRRRVQSAENGVENRIKSSIESSSAVEFLRDGVDLFCFRQPLRKRRSGRKRSVSFRPYSSSSPLEGQRNETLTLHQTHPRSPYPSRDLQSQSSAQQPQLVERSRRSLPQLRSTRGRTASSSAAKRWSWCRSSRVRR